MRELLNDRSSLLRPARGAAPPPARRPTLLGPDADPALREGALAAPLRLLRLAALGRAEAGRALGEAGGGAWTAEPASAASASSASLFPLVKLGTPGELYEQLLPTMRSLTGLEAEDHMNTVFGAKWKGVHVFILSEGEGGGGMVVCDYGA